MRKWVRVPWLRPTLHAPLARCMQIVAEKLNWFRYISHFRSVHRGAYFAQLRTTAVRKLLPESWGFMCPVHTPDGSPCGLLNHFTAACRVVTQVRMAGRPLFALQTPPRASCSLVHCTQEAAGGAVMLGLLGWSRGMEDGFRGCDWDCKAVGGAEAGWPCRH